MSELYREEILEHYKEPHNYGEIKDADKVAIAHNALCGDRQQWYLVFEETATGKVIKDISFIGDGCVISTAAASLLSEYIKGKLVSELENMDQKTMENLIGTNVTEARMKCLMLSLNTLKEELL